MGKEEEEEIRVAEEGEVAVDSDPAPLATRLDSGTELEVEVGIYGSWLPPPPRLLLLRVVVADGEKKRPRPRARGGVIDR